MTQDKELLLKDLCARLPYGVKVEITHWRNRDKGIIDSKIFRFPLDVNKASVLIKPTSDVRPYLFPLSSLTEEQRNDISKLLIKTRNEFSPYGKLNMKGCDNLFICTVKQANVFINYCLTYHLDINGLIEKGLAIDATGLNIY